MSDTPNRVTRPEWIPVRENGTGWLLFRFDPARQLIEIQRRGVKTVVDLTEYAKSETNHDARRDSTRTG